MIPPTQSPATAAAEAILPGWYEGIEMERKRVAAIITSAYSSTEQELREARAVLEEISAHLYSPQDRERCRDLAKAFLSKNSNLPRE